MSARVVFLGPIGTYSHQAALQMFDGRPERLVAAPSISALFDELTNRTAHAALVPYRNSSNGDVDLTHELMAALPTPRARAVDCTFVDVEHYALVSAETAARLRAQGPAAVTRLVTHPQAWGQCTRWLAGNFTHARRDDVDSTSRAAEIAAAEPGTLAIASRAAMAVHNVEAYAERIQDFLGNYTIFVLL
ncbi:Prephenate dehydratase, partial [Dipodascopsis tothii]|uniref:Prephenate dehydratase n=1 Tax=Dipodascopsis tothii TaxID=44089 RepID=UPI0034CFF5B3